MVVREFVTDEPQRGAMYELWPGGYRKLLSEFAFEPHEWAKPILVANDGHFVTHGMVSSDANAPWITIHDADGKIVRTLRAPDVITASDQQWLSRGEANDVRFAVVDDTLRITILTTDGKWDDLDARHHSIDVDLATGDAPAPERDHCPPALRIVAKANDGMSQALLDRAVLRVMPEYPPVAMKARITGVVVVEVVVDVEGNVESAKILKPIPFGIDRAVEKAITQWKFAPASERAVGDIEFTFEILRHIPLRTTYVATNAMDTRAGSIRRRRDFSPVRTAMRGRPWR